MPSKVQQIQQGLLELTIQISSFSNSFYDYKNVDGDPVSDNLTSTLTLNFKSHQSAWKSRALKEKAFHDLIDHLGDDMPSLSRRSKNCFEIDVAYFGSKDTLGTIIDCLGDGIFHNDDFRDLERRKYDFDELEEFYIDGHIHMESRFVFCTPSFPHVTIISVQPQQGPPDKLMLTELFTLMYWAHRYVRRGKHFMSLPIRVVSLCNTKARFLSANFSHGYLRCLAKVDIPKGLPVTADVDIGIYYDLSQKDDFIRFMRQIVDDPVCPDVYAS